MRRNLTFQTRAVLAGWNCKGLRECRTGSFHHHSDLQDSQRTRSTTSSFPHSTDATSEIMTAEFHFCFGIPYFHRHHLHLYGRFPGKSGLAGSLSMVVHKCQPLSKDRPHHADTTARPHYTTFFTPHRHHNHTTFCFTNVTPHYI